MKHTHQFLLLALFFFSCSEEEEPLSLTNQVFEVKYRLEYFEPFQRVEEGISTMEFHHIRTIADREHYTSTNNIPKLRDLELRYWLDQEVENSIHEYIVWGKTGFFRWNEETNEITGEFLLHRLGDYIPSMRQYHKITQWHLTISSAND